MRRGVFFFSIQNKNDLQWLGSLLVRSVSWKVRKSCLPYPSHFQFFWRFLNASNPYHMILCLQTAVMFRGGIPVVILLEGEGFVSGLVSRFPGQDLAGEGVIVVSVSYRLNVFGKWRRTGRVVCIQVIRIKLSQSFLENSSLLGYCFVLANKQQPKYLTRHVDLSDTDLLVLACAIQLFVLILRFLHSSTCIVI